jgi:hypothetical protein
MLAASWQLLGGKAKPPARQLALDLLSVQGFERTTQAVILFSTLPVQKHGAELQLHVALGDKHGTVNHAFVVACRHLTLLRRTARTLALAS